MPRSLTPDQLTRVHSSIPRNPLIADVLYRANYVDRAGTGTLDMISKCRAFGLGDPEFFQDGDQWVVRIWRDWLTADFIRLLDAPERLKRAMAYMKDHGAIDNRTYQEVFETAERTAARDLKALTDMGILVREGETGRRPQTGAMRAAGCLSAKRSNSLRPNHRRQNPISPRRPPSPSTPSCVRSRSNTLSIRAFCMRF